jgi:hypothetical protein
VNQHLELDFTFVGVAYRRTLSDRIPRVFRNPVPFTSQAYSQIRLFVPRRRLVYVEPGRRSAPGGSLGGIPGENVPLPGPAGAPPPPSPPSQGQTRIVVRQSDRWHPDDWDLLNQNWNLQLVPAMSPSILPILGRQPPLGNLPSYTLPDTSTLQETDLRWLSHH